MSEKYYITWDEMKKIKLDCSEFDLLIGLSRGGLVPTQVLAYQNNIRNIITLSCSSYNDQDKTDVVLLEGIIENSLKIKKAEKILIVDDICDTGDTLNAVEKAIQDIRNEKETYDKYVFVNKNPNMEKLNYTLDLSREGWIVFPWDE